MSTCQQCGTGNSPNKTNCTTCGTTIARGTCDLPEDISQLWRIRFDLIEKAGGPALPQHKRLRIGERFRVMFNLWAFIFGPFYYLAKGMWRKGITIFSPGLALLILTTILAPDGELDSILSAVNYATVATFTLRANISYYRKMVLGDNGWW